MLNKSQLTHDIYDSPWVIQNPWGCYRVIATIATIVTIATTATLTVL